jgi:N6-adenosine-specific RNA methylase IME4
MKVSELKPHPLSQAIYGEPDLGLLDSIQKLGILEPLVVKRDGTIISGHRRWRAALALGIEEVPCRVEDYEDELREHEAVIEYNRQRIKTFSQVMAEAEKLKEIEAEKAKRRMVEGGRIGVIVKNADGCFDMKQGVQTFAQGEKGKSRDKVAEKLGMSGFQFEKAEKVWQAAKSGDEVAKKLVEALDKKTTSIHSAYKRLTAKKPMPAPPLPEGKYDLVYADPPWRYDFAKTYTRAVENQYPTLSLEEICALDVPSITGDDAMLFLWATPPLLRQALQVIDAWGFEYKTQMVWVKDKIGMGFYVRLKHELLLIAKKGEYPLPDESIRPESVIFAPRTEHSKKPDVVYEILERMYPQARKIELFARQKREGWDIWGA